MLSVSGARVSFGRVKAVDGVDLEVATGEVVAILGPSGCGKSTLLRAVAGLQPLDSGEVRWDGESLEGLPVHRRDFGLMFQEHALFLPPRRGRQRRLRAAHAEDGRPGPPTAGPRRAGPRGAGRLRRADDRHAVGRRGSTGGVGPLAGARAPSADARRAAGVARPPPPRRAHRGAPVAAAPSRRHRAARHPRPRRGLPRWPTGWRSCSRAASPASAPPPKSGTIPDGPTSPASWATPTWSRWARTAQSPGAVCMCPQGPAVLRADAFRRADAPPSGAGRAAADNTVTGTVSDARFRGDRYELTLRTEPGAVGVAGPGRPPRLRGRHAHICRRPGPGSDSPGIHANRVTPCLEKSPASQRQPSLPGGRAEHDAASLARASQVGRRPPLLGGVCWVTPQRGGGSGGR